MLDDVGLPEFQVTDATGQVVQLALDAIQYGLKAFHRIKAFHRMKLVNEAVDAVRKGEVR